MRLRSIRGPFACVLSLALAAVACKGEVAASGLAASSGGRDGASKSGGATAVAGHAGAGASGSGGAGQTPRDAGVPIQDARVADAAMDANVTRPPDASMSGADSGSLPDAAPPPDATVAQGNPIVVAVGYLGLRVTSKDRGRSWETPQAFPNPGGDLDNPLLLRCVTYGKGLFVAGGHRIFTSPDGSTWTERDNPSNQWFGGVQWGNNRFVAAGGYGESWYSDDGITWHSGGKRGSNSHARSIAFGHGEFRASTDEGIWWRSTNGEAWTQVSGGHDSHVVFCNDDFHDRDDCPPAFGHETYVKGGEWDQDIISWSSDNSSWHNVHVDYVGSLTGIAFGFD